MQSLPAAQTVEHDITMVIGLIPKEMHDLKKNKKEKA